MTTPWCFEYLFFVQIPKTAGNSIIQMIESVRGKEKFIVKPHRPTLNEDGTIKVELLHVNSSNNSYNFKYGNFHTFTFVRDPYTRCLSAYKYLLHGGANYELDLSYQEIIKSYPSFLDFIKDLPKIKTIIVHFVEQYKYVCDENDVVLVKYVGKFENLIEDVRVFEPSVSDNIHAFASQKVDIELTDEIKEIIYNNYEKDFTIFGYKF